MNLEHTIRLRLQAEREGEQKSAARVVAALAAPLPRQRYPWFKRWPSALLDSDFAPAWPRIAALASVALIGCTIGFFGPGTRAFQRTGWSTVQNLDSDVSGFVFEPEPLTGARP